MKSALLLQTGIIEGKFNPSAALLLRTQGTPRDIASNTFIFTPDPESKGATKIPLVEINAVDESTKP